MHRPADCPHWDYKDEHPDCQCPCTSRCNGEECEPKRPTLPMVPAVKASVRKPPAVASVEWTVARYEAADERRRLMG